MKKKIGKFVYKNRECMQKIYDFYDKSLSSLNVSYKEKYINTSFGLTHILMVGDSNKPPIFTLHGGNGINPLNIKLFLPLLKHYCFIAPDVIGMPGKSEPHRNISSKTDEYGLWLVEILNHMNINKIPFVVSSYSSSMLLSLAKVSPERIDKAMLLVPSGIVHGKILPMMNKMAIPFMSYYFKPSEDKLKKIIEVMVSNNDDLWTEFFDLMMSSYKMEMRAPREYKRKELEQFNSEVIIFASNEDIFFPAEKVFLKSKEILKKEPHVYLIKSNHLPSEKVMTYVCNKTIEIFMNNNE